MSISAPPSRTELSVGPVRLSGRAFLAPMASVTDRPFRALAAGFGAGLVVSEMVADSHLLARESEAVLRAEAGNVQPHVVQLAGRDPGPMAEAARIAEGAGAAIIDINMGCPAKRVASGACGAALMKDLDRAVAIASAVVEAVSVPVTAKMRLGWDEGEIVAPRLARLLEGVGIRMITVHGRTRKQFYRGQANWRAIRAVKEAVGVPVVANGDLTSPGEAWRMLEESGADALMIGRGAYGRPWLPGQVSALLAGRPVPAPPDGAALRDLVLAHYEAILSFYGTAAGVRIARKHLGWYLDGIGHTQGELRQAILTATEPALVAERLARAFCDARRLAA